MRRTVCFLVFLVSAFVDLCAQEADDEQTWYSSPEDEDVRYSAPDEQFWRTSPEEQFWRTDTEEQVWRTEPDDAAAPIESHTDILAPLVYDTDGIFMRLSRYDLGFASHRGRGYDERLSRRFLGALEVSSYGKYPDYGLYSALGYTSTANAGKYYYERTPYGAGTAGAVTEYMMGPEYAREGLSAAVNYTTRRYRANIRVAGAGAIGTRSRYAFKLQRRWGRDAHIGGVFADAGSASLSFGTDLKWGHSLTLFAMAAPSLQGTKSSATMEAFELTGNRWYNPSWGYFKGKELNSRMRRELTPVVAAAYRIPARGSRTTYTVSAGYRFGERSRSGLAWFDARNPAPDYYMNMPSYFADPEMAAEVARVWRSGDASYTQLDWAHLWEANLLSDTTASFLLQDMAERVNDIQAVLSASTVVDRRLKLDWGLRLRGERTNYFKRVRSMPGGDYIFDVDQFLIDDQYYGSKYHNDVRNPGRKVRQGDRFGYDYDIRRSEASLFLGGEYSESAAWAFAFAGELALRSLQREGNYEKETFPGELSYGRSERLAFTTWALDASVRRSFSIHHSAWLYLSAAEREPFHEDIFLNPESHNIMAPTENMSFVSAGVRYHGFVAGFVTLELSAYFTQSRRGQEILRYYDDLYAEYSSDDLSGYSVMTMHGIDKRYLGIEAAASIDITTRLKLSLAGAVGGYTYTSNPSVAIHADVNLHQRLAESESRLSGYIAAPSPQAVFISSLTYSTPSRWRVEVGWSYAGHRYVTPSPVRRTGRIVELASSPEMKHEFGTQERLPDASSLSLYISKGFLIAGRYMYASVSVDNLLGSTIIYGGYEQHRIRKEGTGINRTYSPFPSKYSYSYPRTFYFTVSANF